MILLWIHLIMYKKYSMRIKAKKQKVKVFTYTFMENIIKCQSECSSIIHTAKVVSQIKAKS